MPPDPETIRPAEEVLHPEERVVRDQHGHPLPGTGESPDHIEGADAPSNDAGTSDTDGDPAARRP